MKVSVLKGHLQSEGGKQQLLAKEARERDIATLLQQHHKDNHLEGESLPIGQQVYCVKVLTAFLCAAIPLGKVDCFRQVLEENALRLTDRSHLANLVPFVHQEQHTRLKEEMRDKQVSVIFDGTTRLGEAMVVVLRFISKDWELQQRLVRLHMLAKSMTGEEIARVLISTLSVLYSIPSNCLLAAMKDRASVNGVAMRTLQIVYPMAVDIGCFSHTINLVGERFKMPLSQSSLIHGFHFSLIALKLDSTGRSAQELLFVLTLPPVNGKLSSRQWSCLETFCPSLPLVKNSQLPSEESSSPF